MKIGILSWRQRLKEQILDDLLCIPSPILNWSHVLRFLDLCFLLASPHLQMQDILSPHNISFKDYRRAINCLWGSQSILRNLHAYGDGTPEKFLSEFVQVTAHYETRKKSLQSPNSWSLRKSYSIMSFVIFPRLRKNLQLEEFHEKNSYLWKWTDQAAN